MEHAPKPADTDTRQHRILAIVRWVLALIILASLILIVWLLPIGPFMAAVKGWMAGLKMWGPVVLVLVYIVATVLFVPGTALTPVAGALFGLLGGMVVASIGSTLGASSAFLISRHLARDRVAVMAGRNRRFAAIDRAIGKAGWKIVALVRLSPLTLFSVENYLFGLTQIRFWSYAATSWAAMLPGTFLYVYLGHVAGAAVVGDRVRTLWEWALLAVGLLATVVATVLITRLAQGKLREQMSEATRDDETPPGASDADPGAGPGAVHLRRTLILAAVALILAVVAALVFVSSGTLERWLTGWVAPRV